MIPSIIDNHQVQQFPHFSLFYRGIIFMCSGIIFFAHLLSLAKECIVHTTHLNKTSVQLAQITHDHRALKHIRKGEMHRHTASQCVSVRFSLASVASVPCNHVPPHNFIIINPELFHVTLLMSCPISHVICTFISFNANFCMYWSNVRDQYTDLRLLTENIF